MIRSDVFRWMPRPVQLLAVTMFLLVFSGCASFQLPEQERRSAHLLGMWQPGARATRLVETDTASAFEQAVDTQRAAGYELLDFAYGALGGYLGLFGQGAARSELELDLTAEALRERIDSRDGLIDVERRGSGYDRRFAALWIDSGVVLFRGRDEVFFDLSHQALLERMRTDLLVEVDLVCPPRVRGQIRSEVRYAGVVREGAAGLRVGVELVTAPSLDALLDALNARPGLRPTDLERCATGADPTYAALLVPVLAPLEPPVESWLVQGLVGGVVAADAWLSRGLRPSLADFEDPPDYFPPVGPHPPLTLVDIEPYLAIFFGPPAQTQVTTSTGSHGPDPDPDPSPGTE